MFLDSISESSNTEIEQAYITSFYEDLTDEERCEEIERLEYKKRVEELVYWSDNCGGDEDHSAEWYCKHCDQEECGKRVAKREYNEHIN